MKNVYKSFTISLLAIVFLAQSAYAYVLGELTNIETRNLYNGLDYYNVEFTSKDVGKQTEHFFEYVPNINVIPTVVNGSQIYGKRTLTQAAGYLNKTESAIVGMNADYFSFQTGIPMGHTIINGEIVTKDTQIMDAIGFYDNGTAIIGELGISTTISSSYGTIEIDNINKWCQPDMNTIYMINDRFGATTKTKSKCYFVVLSIIDGALKFGDNTLRLKVDTAYEYSGEINIPNNKYILVMDVDTADASKLAFIKSLIVGDELTVSSKVSSRDERFNSVYNAIGSIGGRLLKNGTVNSGLQAGAAPRSAVGINSYGTVIFYTIDGRQKGYSYGVQLTTLAKRLKELGCVEAINLDGGGSTTIGADFGFGFNVLNKPSDGSERACANFLFLKLGGNNDIDSPANNNNNDVFYDIYNSWAHDEITELYSLGIVSGYYVNDRLCYLPNDSITRAEFATLIMKYMGGGNAQYNNTYSIYNDSYLFSDWMREPISFVTSNYIMNGRYDNYFAPNEYITREEAITALARIDNSSVIVEATSFMDDSQISEWAKTPVENFRMRGIVKGDYNNCFNPKNNVTKQEAAAIIYRLLN